MRKPIGIGIAWAVRASFAFPLSPPCKIQRPFRSNSPRDYVTLLHVGPVGDGSDVQATVNEPTSEPAPPTRLTEDGAITDGAAPEKNNEAATEVPEEEEMDTQLQYDEGNMRKAIQMAQSA